MKPNLVIIIPTYGIINSIARGEEKTGSDVDLLVISEVLTYPDIFPSLATI